MNEDFFDRLDKYMKYSKLNDNQLTVKANLSIGSLGKQRKGSRGLSSDSIAKILCSCPDLSAEWLLTGRGTILNTKSTENVINLNDTSNDTIFDTERKVQKTLSNENYLTSIPNRNRFSKVSDVEGKYEAPILLEEPGAGVPYYDVDFCAGFDLVFNDQTAVPAGYVNIPQYRNADSLANITGHSMEPLISNGDIIALKRLEDWRTYLLYGEIYGVMTDEYRTVKKVRKGHDQDHVILEPINKSEFEETEIPKSIITGVWMVLGCVKKLF